MEEDHSWMYRRTVPGVIGISSEFQLGNELRCPCSNCKILKYLKEDDVKLYLYKSRKYTTKLRMHFPSSTKSDMEKPVNASNNEYLKYLSWGPSKRDVRYCQWEQQGPHLWFRLTVCSRYRERRGGSNSLSSVPSVSSDGSPQGPYQEGEEVLRIHAAGTGQVCQLHDIIRISVWSAAGFGTHSLPSFPAAG
ncbi:hypothetical protein M9H77_03167 [Catharanthus roseus]|uniref:Uncharacterized protein n=1 Tax=Catharanthus roseus TaxID=4058 RepID=A0ACC0CAM7_CATRO|nr:hypothetical protein M9H77_03167 [Catharanthus roseus]